MKTKTVYYFFVILIIVVLASAIFTAWLNREQTKILPAVKEPATVMPETQNHLVHSSQTVPLPGEPQEQLPPKSISSIVQVPGITVISQEPTMQTPGIAKLPEKQQIKNIPSQPAQNSQPAITSGYKKIGKTPPETESKEMNQQGIIMY